MKYWTYLSIFESAEFITRSGESAYTFTTDLKVSNSLILIEAAWDYFRFLLFDLKVLLKIPELDWGVDIIVTKESESESLSCFGDYERSYLEFPSCLMLFTWLISSFSLFSNTIML